ncbi:hypothetical protein SESBI_30521 [Sesbania bispinosa]|nr:hypothetical protein SESBI_30521 [Sesbania bispinosa]
MTKAGEARKREKESGRAEETEWRPRRSPWEEMVRGGEGRGKTERMRGMLACENSGWITDNGGRTPMRPVRDAAARGSEEVMTLRLRLAYRRREGAVMDLHRPSLCLLFSPVLLNVWNQIIATEEKENERGILPLLQHATLVQTFGQRNHAIIRIFGAEKDDQEKHLNQNMKYQAEDVASRATRTMKSASSGPSDYASQKATDAKEAVSGAMAYGRENTSEGVDEIIKMQTDAKDKMRETYEGAKQKMDKVSDMASGNANDERFKMASQRVYDVKNKVKGAMDCGIDKANEAKDKMGVASDKMVETFDQAKHEVGDAYLSAKNTMTEKAKGRYESTKEKASEATGELGAKMRLHQYIRELRLRMRAVEAAKKQSRSFEGSKSGSAEERKALMEEIATLRSQVKELESECEVKGSSATAL